MNISIQEISTFLLMKKEKPSPSPTGRLICRLIHFFFNSKNDLIIIIVLKLFLIFEMTTSRFLTYKLFLLLDLVYFYFHLYIYMNSVLLLSNQIEYFHNNKVKQDICTLTSSL